MKTKTINKALLFGLILGLVMLGGGYVGYRAYKSARQARLITQARNYLAKPNARKALLCLQRALRYNPKDVEACRLMAELTERARSPGALIWRSRVVELKPHSLDDRLALAQTAIMMRDYVTATNALEAVDAPGKKTAAYHNVAGAVASTLKQLPQAEAHFLEAARLEPANTAPQLNLAVVRLHGTNNQSLAEARAVLTRLSANPTNSTLRCQALRELVVDALRFKRNDAALALSRDLLQQTNSAFTDRLLRLTVLRETVSAGFQSALADFQRDATQGTNAPVKTYELATWQIANTGPKEALAWLSTLPKASQTNQTVAVLIAECQIRVQDWHGLQAFLDRQNWAELEFLRHAFMARGLRGQDMAGAAKGEWEMALQAANHQRTGLVNLVSLADQWNWASEKEELLWSIVNQSPGERWAVQALSQALFIGGRTRPLMMLYSQELKRTPSNLPAKNDLAMLALLLEADEMTPYDLAREVYQKAPTNAAYASTYAYSLHVQKKDAEALKVMQQLKPQQLNDPSIAGYYGLILQATGNREKARAYLQWSSKAQTLPEEKKIFDRARAGV
jgi:tetratricopeptide (TPR) repeat protein